MIAKRLEEKKEALLRRVSRLRATKGRRNCLEFAHTCPEGPMAIEGARIDTKPWLLPCANGVLDLRTGELADGRPEDYLLKACPVAWEGIDASRETWERFLLKVMQGNQEMVDFLQRAFGMALVGMVIEGVLVVLNGKGTMVETICEILGPLAAPIRSEMLLGQFRTASPSGPSPEIMALRGLRLAFASETDDGCRISPSRVKWLTGNDTLTGRSPHDKYEINFKPTHTLFLQTNHLPHAPADDFAYWERMVVVPFGLSYVNREPTADDERRADKHLPAKLRQEIPGILVWLVAGCLRWQQAGLKPPAPVQAAGEEYQRDEDHLGDFIDECLILDSEAHLGATEVYSVFEGWWKKNISKNSLKQKRFGKLFGKRFERKKEGINYYLGVGFSADAYRYLDEKAPIGA